MFKLFFIFDFAIEKSKLIQGHHLNNRGGTGVPMLHTKFQGHRSIGSGEEDF